MKRLTAIMLLCTTLLVFSGCGKDKKVSTKVSDDSDAVNVTVEEVQKNTIEDTVTYTGAIEAIETTNVSAKVSGTAKAVYKDVGDYVHAGELLVQIDDTDYRIQYDKAVAGLNQAKAAQEQAKAAQEQANAAYQGALASYNSVINGSAEQTKLQLKTALDAAKIEYNNAKTNYDNQKVLYESGAISKSTYDSAVTRYDNAQLNLDTAQNNYDLSVSVILQENEANAKSGVESAQASVSSAQASIDSSKSAVDIAAVAVEAAQIALDNTVVRAPISGYITKRNTNKGQMVAQGVDIFTIKATQTVDAKINVTESVISCIAIGTKAVVSIKAAGIENIEGTVSNLNPVKDAQTGMYSVSVEISNADGVIKDGMFADITLTLKDSANAFVIPSEAILEDEEGTKYIYIANGDTAKRADIEIGIVTDEYTEIISGISEGDQVIVSGKDYLSDKNNKIKVVK